MKLYTYFRSSAAYRVRIALHLKGLAFDSVPVHLLREGGQQHAAAYAALNPNETVPTLDDDGQILTQSLAIIEYLDETHPSPPLLPGSAADRARMRAIAQTIASDIHPINNLRVLQHLTRSFDVSEAQKSAWYCHWVDRGLQTVEKMLARDPRTGRFCHGDAPTLADCCLVPQVFNARRFGCSLTGLSTVLRICAECEELEAFRRAAPQHQPDAE
ncbi:maleylacetoacetate isomerase [Thiomonas intermedia]|uniref:maleylacetoacetate isomerase n=1 Tax=Thiomonas intermedia TaxID=926 RepID=UPI0009A54C92|nr:maleylacetoacetate isomerase [Thiomonas intermedia]